MVMEYYTIKCPKCGGKYYLKTCMFSCVLECCCGYKISLLSDRGMDKKEEKRSQK